MTNLGSGTGASVSTFWRGDGSWGTPIGSGTVTATGGALTLDQLVLGAGGNDIKVTGVTPTAAGLALLDDADAAAQRVTLGGVITSGEIDTADDLSAMIGGQTTGTGNFVRSTGGTINDSRRTVHALGNLSGSSTLNFTTGGVGRRQRRQATLLSPTSLCLQAQWES